MEGGESDGRGQRAGHRPEDAEARHEECEEAPSPATKTASSMRASGESAGPRSSEAGL